MNHSLVGLMAEFVHPYRSGKNPAIENMDNACLVYTRRQLILLISGQNFFGFWLDFFSFSLLPIENSNGVFRNGFPLTLSVFYTVFFTIEPTKS